MKAVTDFLEDALGDLVLLFRQLLRQRLEPISREADGEVGSVRDREIVDLHAERFGTQTFAHAGGAWRGGLVAADFLAHPGAVGFTESAIEVADDALERLGDFVAAHAIVEDEVDFFLACAEEDDLARTLGQLVPGGVERELVLLGQRLECLFLQRRGGLAPGRDGAVAERLVGFRDDEIRVDLQLFAEPVAGRAGSERVVEREQARLNLLDGEAGDRAGELGRECYAARFLGFGIFVGELGDGDAVSKTEGGLETFGQALFHA